MVITYLARAGAWHIGLAPNQVPRFNNYNTNAAPNITYVQNTKGAASYMPVLGRTPSHGSACDSAGAAGVHCRLGKPQPWHNTTTNIPTQ